MLDDASCAVVPGCVEGGSCKGQNNACAGFSMDICDTIPGCTFLSSTCRTDTAFCSGRTRRPDCAFFAQQGCSWNPTCTGPAPACGSLGHLACEIEPGCTPGAGTGGGTCTGTPTACRSLNAASCGSVAGCYTVVSCTGSPTGCGGLQVSCSNQVGCNFDGVGCRGTPPPCAGQANANECPRVIGCSWSPVCGGTPLACSQLESQATCQAQAGCSWQAQ